MVRTINITNARVLEAYENAAKDKKASRLIEEAVLYYLDSLEEEKISKEMIKDIVIECLKGGVVPLQGISNENYQPEQLADDINDILGL